MSKLPETGPSLLRYLRQQKRVVTRMANATPYALSGTSVTAPGLTKVDDRIVAGTAGGSRVELDAAGLRKYGANGTDVEVDMTGPTAVFSGIVTASEIVGSEFKTAASGARVEVVPVEGVWDGGKVRFYSGSVDETRPGEMWGFESVGQGYLMLRSPGMTGLTDASIVLATAAEGRVEIFADYASINPSVVDETTTHIGGGNLMTNVTTLEIGSGDAGGPYLMRRIFAVADATERAALVADYVEALRSRVIDSTHPLFIWKADEAPGAQLQSTVDGTTFATIGGGGSTLFADPNADRLVFWDDSAGAFAPLTASTGLTLTGTDLTLRSATDALMGGVELATSAETVTGTDDTRATTPAGVKAAREVWSRLDTTNALGSVRRQWGIARLTAPGGTNRATPLAVTFPVAFSGIPHVTAGALGYRATGAWDPTDLTAGTTEQWFVPVTGRSTTAMILNIVDIFSASISAGYDLYVSWEAVGPA